MIKAIFFDLDGTLLPINEDDFRKMYFSLLIEKRAAPLGFEPKKFMDTLLQSMIAMMKNDGTRTNREVFWSLFTDVYGPGSEKAEAEFATFYDNEFKHLISVCDTTEESRKIIDKVKELGLLCVLSTNPIFPMSAQVTRMSFVGLKPEDFAYVTSYENSTCCKPNPLYFKQLLEKYNLKSNEVVVIGNDDYEDGDCASSLGIKVYLVKEHIIHNKHAKGKYPEVSLSEVKSIIEREVESAKNC